MTITALPDGPDAQSPAIDTIPEAVGRLIWFVRESPPVAPYDLATIASYGAAIVPSVDGVAAGRA